MGIISPNIIYRRPSDPLVFLVYRKGINIIYFSQGYKDYFFYDILED